MCSSDLMSFTRVLWAGLYRFVLFAEVPSLWTWAGAAAIIGATTHIVRRDAILQRASGGGGYPPAMN